ncbi:transposase [Mangrovicoccus ximenensis]
MHGAPPGLASDRPPDGSPLRGPARTPRQHRTRLHSANPMERLNKEMKRRVGAVGVGREILPRKDF